MRQTCGAFVAFAVLALLLVGPMALAVSSQEEPVLPCLNGMLCER